MKSLQTILITAALTLAMVSSTSVSAKPREKRCQTISTCRLPMPVTVTPSTSQAGTPTQTCCQPATASVQPRIELITYTRPSAPQRLIPQPDALEINPTAAQTTCAQFMIHDFGTFKSYYGLRCTDNNPTIFYGNGLAPLPGSCANPNGACVTIGSSVVQAAFESGPSSAEGRVFQTAIRLKQKLKAGAEPNNKANPLATKPHQLKERTRIGKPIYVSFARDSESSERVVVELQRYSVKGNGISGQELTGTFAMGTEIDVAPARAAVKEMDLSQVHVISDNVAQIKLSGVTYDIVTATKLAKSR